MRKKWALVAVVFAVGAACAWVAGSMQQPGPAAAAANQAATLQWVIGNEQGEARTILGNKPITYGNRQGGEHQGVDTTPLKLEKNRVALLKCHYGDDLRHCEVLGYLERVPANERVPHEVPVP